MEIQISGRGSPDKFSSDLLLPVPAGVGEDDRRSLGKWIVRYLTTYATGVPATLRYKKEDLALFYGWFVWAFGSDDISRWNRASTNAFVQTLSRETVQVAGRGKRSGELRWSARSLNRKIDHLRTFAKWIAAQIPPLVTENPTHGVKRFDVPILQAQRLTDKEVIRLETAARGLQGTRIKRDKRRTDLGILEVRADARPARDLAVYKLLIGSGLRVSALANLDLSQFSGRKLVRVKEKGSQEREVVISTEASEAIMYYLRAERPKDAETFGHAGGGPLFLSVPQQAVKRKAETDGRLTSRAVFASVRRLAEDAFGEEDAKRIHPHLFRHHVGHLMNERGGITAVQKQLAHRNIAYSAVYAQKTDEELGRMLDGK